MHYVRHLYNGTCSSLVRDVLDLHKRATNTITKVACITFTMVCAVHWSRYMMYVMYAMYTNLEATGIWVVRFVKRQLECMTENGCLDATLGLFRGSLPQIGPFGK
ncbi:hypothetical protein IscW_ISCW005970 [Ixodes scapularis]|uniref:Uncharacterized protein n=1 Tax=Ixodes scapularis TaxID=6945 RepID=B7PMI9_IXOSC|nr:hypothetical protein IscW_ISCW005970 [Ixodes scapularis]|eukprot:XP_002434987.1 hypothetical protein IscW_ISCW005970 [Ixodes scapularis]